MRLNLGCGDKHWPGFVNVDRHADPVLGPPDVISDVTPLAFAETNSADEIHAIHVLEHLPRMQADAAVAEWFRVLKRGGKLVLEVPCLDKIAKMIVEGEKNIRMTQLGLFGDPRDGKPDMLHHWCYAADELREVLIGVGFTSVAEQEPVFHYKARDMRVEGVKP